jgi:putative hydrolase of the HAD superfamily
VKLIDENLYKMYKNTMKYKALLMDMDDTLITSGQIYDKALKYSSTFLAEKYNLDVEKFFAIVKEKHSIINNNFPTVHTRHSRILVFRMALDEVVHHYDIGILPYVEDMYWNFFIKNVKVFPGVISTLSKLHSMGIKLAIVSDGDLSLRIRKAKAKGLLKYLDELVASEEVIFEKPFSAIFTLAMSRLKTEPEYTVMLGNDYKSDIRGAQLLGIRAGVFIPRKDSNAINQDGTIVPDFVINKFSDVIKEFE